MKHRFSLKNKLVIIFGLLILTAGLTEGILAIRTARKAVTEKVETHLIDKANDIAEIVDGRINTVFQFIEGLTRMPVLRDTNLSFTQKAQSLAKEAEHNKIIQYFGVCDIQGNLYDSSGGYTMISDRDWFQAASQGRNFIAEPLYCVASISFKLLLPYRLKIIIMQLSAY